MGIDHMVVPSGSVATEAHAYLERGFSVIPLASPVAGDRSSGKKPAIPWKAFQSRKATHAEVDQWFAGLSRNVGIVTGSISGIVVVDCDDDQAEAWCRDRLSDTHMIARTGSGFHLFYSHPGGIIRNGAKLEGLNLDLRADGGYVVAPPSLHHTGNLYVKLGDWTVRPPLFDPSWIARHQGRQESIVYEERRCEDRICQRARKYVARMHSIAGSGGDLNLFRVACVLIQKFGLPFDIALEELRRWNSTNAQPPWDDKRLRYKLNEALRLK